VVQVILCGRGGQGIVFLTRLLGEIATQKGMDVISSETHGMAVRGGSINSHLKIGPFSSPLVIAGHADYLVSLDESETLNNEHFLRKGGIVFENSLLPSKSDLLRVDAAGLARSIGRIQLENVVLLGFSASMADLGVPFCDIKDKLAIETREEVRSYNLAALKAGQEAADQLKVLKFH
jgi:indolepyruvate ferredoxin oxidoreductase, beta subunit